METEPTSIDNQATRHVPVMPETCLELMQVRPGRRYCDATAGAGGHARQIMEASAPDGRLLLLDRDAEAIEFCKDALSEFSDRVIFRQANFCDLRDILAEIGWSGVDGILADLGVSSAQLDTADRGFSFSADGPLDMRLDQSGGRTAAELIAQTDPTTLANIIFEYGEERASRRVARAIKEAHADGRLDGTAALARIVARAVSFKGSRRQRIHPATRTFQALRIAVNDELASLDKFLEEAVRALNLHGVLVIISFHSLEDRRVKRRFVHYSKEPSGEERRPWLRRLTRKPLMASEEEVARNPRSRSAKVRAAERLA